MGRERDLIFYDWDDKGTGDNKGVSDHVGIVEEVSGSTITVIEGNYNNACKRRTLKVDGRYIRGYGVPKYDIEPTAAAVVTVSLPILKKGSKVEAVKTLQRLLNALGFTDASEKALVVDGSFGSATLYALKAYQNAKRLEVDGICGAETWKNILN